MSMTQPKNAQLHLPRSASWIEEMEKRSRRRIRDLVALAALQGLSENEIGCARISMMARSDAASFTGRIRKRKTIVSRSSNPACNARPVHQMCQNRKHSA
jgi:hypothetical protein